MPENPTYDQKVKAAYDSLKSLGNELAMQQKKPFSRPNGFSEASLQRLKSLYSSSELHKYQYPVRNTTIDTSAAFKDVERAKQLREARVKLEAINKSQQPNFEPRYVEGIKPAPAQKYIVHPEWEKEKRLQNQQLIEDYQNKKIAVEQARQNPPPKPTRLTNAAYNQAQIDNNLKVKQEYETRKLERSLGKPSPTPTNPSRRFSAGNTNPLTGKRFDPNSPPFSRGNTNPFTGKPWPKPKPPTTPGSSGISDMVQKAQRNIVQRFNATKGNLGTRQAGGPTSKAASPTRTAVLQRPGAEIPHLAVGSSVTGATLSSRAFGITSNGAVVQSGLGAAVAFGFQVANGMSPQQAAFSAIGVGVGSYVGQIGGTLFGGVPGAIVGQLLGGYLGQLAGDSLYNFLFGSKQKAVKRKPKTEAPPFTGGQSATNYNGEVWYVAINSGEVHHDIDFYNVPGPISGVRVVDDGVRVSGHDVLTPLGWFPVSRRDRVTGHYSSPSLRNLRRSDGQPDTGGNIGVVSPNAKATTPATLQSSPYSPPGSYLPGNQTSTPTLKNVVPPLADLPHEKNKRKPLNITVPAGKSITLTAPDGNSVTVAPASVPRTINIPRSMPRSAGAEDDPAIAPLPITITSPGSAPIILTAPGTGSTTISIPGQQPITFDPTAKTPTTGLTANPLTPGKLTPTPTVTPTTTPTTTQPPTTPDAIPDIEDLLLPLGIAGGLAGLGLLIKQIHDRTTPQALETAAAAGTCRTTQPGGCSSNLANKNTEDIKKKFDNSATANAADAALGADTNFRVRRIENAVGVLEFPMTVPKYLLDDHLDVPEVILNQVQYNAWLLKQIDALVGLFPIKIERTNEDNVKETLVFENIAEAIAEITGLLANIAFDADTAVNVATRSNAEAVGAKIAALQAGSYLKAIVDYMGFQGQAVSIDVPISCTPGAVGLDGKLQESELKDFLKPSVQKAIGFKNTDPIDQRLSLRRLMENTEITRASVYHPLKSDPTKNLLTGDAIKADKVAEKKRTDDLWEKFKLRMEGHTGGTRVDIDDNTQPPTTP